MNTRQNWCLDICASQYPLVAFDINPALTSLNINYKDKKSRQRGNIMSYFIATFSDLSNIRNGWIQTHKWRSWLCFLLCVLFSGILIMVLGGSPTTTTTNQQQTLVQVVYLGDVVTMKMFHCRKSNWLTVLSLTFHIHHYAHVKARLLVSALSEWQLYQAHSW